LAGDYTRTHMHLPRGVWANEGLGVREGDQVYTLLYAHNYQPRNIQVIIRSLVLV
jgi:hypothetical protein